MVTEVWGGVNGGEMEIGCLRGRLEMILRNGESLDWGLRFGWDLVGSEEGWRRRLMVLVLVGVE